MMILEGILHLSQGERVRFACSEPGGIVALVSQVMTGKVWSRPTLVVAEARHLTALATADVVRVDLNAHPDVEAAFHRRTQSDGDASDAVRGADQGTTQQNLVREEIPAAAYLEGASRMASQITTRDDLVALPGSPIEVWGRLSLRGGGTVHHHYALATPTAFEQRRFLANVFPLSGLPFRALPQFPDAGPGIAVLNPHAIVSATFHPGATPTVDTWNVDATYMETPQGVVF